MDVARVKRIEKTDTGLDRVILHNIEAADYQPSPELIQNWKTVEVKVIHRKKAGPLPKKGDWVTFTAKSFNETGLPREPIYDGIRSSQPKKKRD